MRIVILIVAGILTTAEPSRALADEWWDYGGHQYRMTTTVGNWDQAEAEAIAAGGHLVTINSATESEWLLATFPSPSGGCWWIGLHQVPIFEPNPAAGWEWASGEPVTFTASNWPSGEPNDDGGDHHEYWAQMWAGPPGIPGNWNDLGPESSGYMDQPGIIEAVPEPATLCLLGLSGLVPLRRWHR